MPPSGHMEALHEPDSPPLCIFEELWERIISIIVYDLALLIIIYIPAICLHSALFILYGFNVLADRILFPCR